jgi:dTDP-4-amino-4,6-dideoxygalactose transaminase
MKDTMIEYENLAKLNEPFFNEYLESFRNTMEKGWYILGDNVKKFEEEFAKYCGAGYCVGVASGLDALSLAINALDFPPASEIIVPSNAYIATILSVLHNNHIPVFVEPDINTYNIDPYLIEEKVSPKTRAVLLVHLYGKPCNMQAVQEVCNKYGLKLIEDCAQSHGAKYKGRMTGTFGDFGAFSFYPTKNLGALGDAGALLTDSAEMADKIKKLRNYGSGKKYMNEYVGFNSRLDEVQAGFLSVKLGKLDAINDHKRQLAETYMELLCDDFIKPVFDPDYLDVFHIFAVRHTKRDALRQYLLDNGIKTEIHYPVPPHEQDALKDILIDKDFPLSSEIHNTILSLPVSFFHTKQDIIRIAEVMNSFK